MGMAACESHHHDGGGTQLAAAVVMALRARSFEASTAREAARNAAQAMRSACSSLNARRRRHGFFQALEYVVGRNLRGLSQAIRRGNGPIRVEAGFK